MSASEKLKQQHVEAATEQWDRAVEKAHYLLTYKREPLVAEVAKAFLKASGRVRYRLGGGGSRTAHGIGNAYTPYDVLCQMNDLVGYQILDDGDPGIGYMHYDFHEGYVQCGPNDEEAEPYFHVSVEELRKTRPDAKYLDFEQALEIIKWHMQKEKVLDEWCRENEDEEDWPTGPSERERLLSDLADELSQEK